MIEIHFHWLAAMFSLIGIISLVFICCWHLFRLFIRHNYFPITHCASCHEPLYPSIAGSVPGVVVVQLNQVPGLSVLCEICSIRVLGPYGEGQIDAEFENEPVLQEVKA